MIQMEFAEVGFLRLNVLISCRLLSSVSKEGVVFTTEDKGGVHLQPSHDIKKKINKQKKKITK